jgi:hypothetical protein
MNGDLSTMMTSTDRELLREFLSLDAERRQAPDVVRRLHRAGWRIESIAALAQLSVDEAIARLQGSP